jgi:regulator of cell morphogenesis and NO signaling
MLTNDLAAPRSGPSEPLPPEFETDANLIARIVNDFHVPHLGVLVSAQDLARRVEAAHAAHPQAPIGLAVLLGTLFETLSVHQAREESVLFPMMLRGATHLAAAIAMMGGDHDEVRAALTRLRRLTGDFTPPHDACGSWRTLYAQCRQFESDLCEHIRLEDEVLFPRFI